MEETYCPLCGKPNPIDNKFCDFCLAHLHPQEGGSTDSEALSIPGIEDNQDGLGGHESDSNVPDWLSELQQSNEMENEETLDSESELGQPANAISDWMTGVSGDGEATVGEVSPTAPFLPDQGINESQDIPHWLNDSLIEEEDQDLLEDERSGEVPLDGEGRDVSRGDSSSPEISEDISSGRENAGPLAGLRGVLPAEPGAARVRKPRTYSAKLKVSTSQRAHIDLLNSLLEDEGQPQPLPPRRSISQQHVLRWGIALVLLMAILWPIVITSHEMPFPDYDEGSAEVNRLISQLPENARVLVGFDFEPGLAAELDTAAAPVFDHLLSEGALLTLISTSPSGPILAERFIQSIQSDQKLIYGLEYVNLGYIPGGAVGLLSFIENPQGTIPFTIDGLSAWETEDRNGLPATAGIDQITDYSMVILLVDDPDTARTWIEQLSPTITNPQALMSFVLITSAQLEPVVRPYYESSPQPVNGLVVGLRGGAAYARIIGSDDFPGRSWDAFGMGTFVAALLILVGGLGYYVIPELSRTARDQEKVKR
ncbi:MAG: zinc ribbon domain-containing protein [Chloroflexi bacterium]|nr:zinc ribbon domain-containing protein [Chloroflexota bacterium]